MTKIYLDATKLNGIAFVGIKDVEIILAGTTINSMGTNEKNDEYQRYSDYYDIEFIFDDFIPQLEFYTVPLVDIIAKDNEGGFIGSLGHPFDLEGNAPICYINRFLECFIVSDNVAHFLKNIESWKKNLVPYDKVTFYSSKVEAEKELKFIDLFEK